MKSEEIQLETIKRMRLRDNDVVIFKTPSIMSCAAIDEMKGIFRSIFKKLPQKNLQMLILSRGEDIEILGKEEI
jgi:hypothetical protein